jgi:hypothetical protein
MHCRQRCLRPSQKHGLLEARQTVRKPPLDFPIPLVTPLPFFPRGWMPFQVQPWETPGQGLPLVTRLVKRGSRLAIHLSTHRSRRAIHSLPVIRKYRVFRRTVYSHPAFPRQMFELRCQPLRGFVLRRLAPPQPRHPPLRRRVRACQSLLRHKKHLRRDPVRRGRQRRFRKGRPQARARCRPELVAMPVLVTEYGVRCTDCRVRSAGHGVRGRGYKVRGREYGVRQPGVLPTRRPSISVGLRRSRRHRG